MSHQTDESTLKRLQKQRERRLANRKDLLAKRRIYDQKRDAEYRAWLDSIKLERGCIDCGYREHPKALHFDHLRDKQRDVCDLKSKRAALKEIAKCEVRCANCHSIKTYERIQSAKANAH